MKNPFSQYGRIVKPVLPLGNGKTFILVPAGSDQITGLQAQFPVDEDGVQRVYTTLASAVAAVVTGRGDQILVCPGTYTISTVVSTSASNFKILGLGNPGEAMFTGSAASILTLTGDGVEIARVGFTIASTLVAITMTGADYCDIHDNVFYSTVGGTGSYFIQQTTASNFNKIRENQFVSNLNVISSGALTQSGHIVLLGTANVVERNVFIASRNSTTANGVVITSIWVATANDATNTLVNAGNLIRQNSFTEVNGATFTAGLDYQMSVSGSTLAVDNNFVLATPANAIVSGNLGVGFANNIATGVV